jgi:GT2 family glycosyltransferase
MITLNDFSFLMVTRGTDVKRLAGVYKSIRQVYPENEIVVVYDQVSNIQINPSDQNLKEVYSSDRVYVSSGYNLALKNATKTCFVFIHDDTFLAKNFLENIIPHISEKQFCNFTTVEPPIYNDPDTLLKPIKDFGRSMDVFNLDSFNAFCEEHVKNIHDPIVPSPFGGFFMAGFKSSIDSVGGFDEYFQPYFYEDADLMLRLHDAGFTFVQVLNSIVYHMGSLTSRGTSESDESMRTTSMLFVKKWKTSWEHARNYTLANSIPYKRIPVEIHAVNCPPQLESFFSLIHEENSDMIIKVDGTRLTQQDFEYLQSLPYVLQSIDEDGQYELGNLIVNYKRGRHNV